MVDIGGRNLHFIVTQGKSPAILLEAGQGQDASVWSQVQSALAKETGNMVISYDRAGFGSSDPAPSNYSIAEEEAALEKALASPALNVSGPIIYVAHSYGAFFAQLYGARNPSKVRSVLLLDPNTVCFNDGGGFTELWSPPPYKGLSTADSKVIGAYPDTIASMRPVPEFPKNIPVTVISSGKPPVKDVALWRSCHENIIKSNPAGKFLIAENSSHNIQLDDPALVVAEIEKQLN